MKKTNLPEGYSRRDIVCAQCGYIGKPKVFTPGYFSIEILLWICFLLSGLIYTVWRGSARYKGCPKCGSKEIVPLNTPRGMKLFKEFESFN